MANPTLSISEHPVVAEFYNELEEQLVEREQQMPLISYMAFHAKNTSDEQLHRNIDRLVRGVARVRTTGLKNMDSTIYGLAMRLEEATMQVNAGELVQYKLARELEGSAT